MKIVSLKKILQTGIHRAESGKVVEVPDEIGKTWIDAKFARVATAAEVESGEVVPEKPKK